MSQQEIERGLKAYFRFGVDIVALRAWTHNKVTVCGVYKNLDKLAVDLALIDDDKDVEGCFYCINPCTEDAYQRSQHKNGFGVGEGVGKDDIQCRSNLFIDIDTIKRSGDVATREEKLASKVVMESVRSALWQEHGIECGVATSGNGWYSLIKLPDLPNDEASRVLMQRFQHYLQSRFGCPHRDAEQKTCGCAAKIDVFQNADRLTRALGTMNRKGIALAGQSYWQSKLVYAPYPWAPVSMEQLQALADMAPKVAQRKASAVTFDSGYEIEPDMIETMLTKFTEAGMIGGFDRYDEGMWDIIGFDPFEAEHSSPITAHNCTVSLIDGVIGFSCLRGHCQSFLDETTGELRKRGWRDFRDACDPGHALYKFPFDEDEEEMDDSAWGGVEDVHEQEVKAEVAELFDLLNEPLTPKCRLCKRTPEEGCLCNPVVVEEVIQKAEAARAAAPEVKDEIPVVTSAAVATEPGMKRLSAMPETSLYGWAGEKARSLGAPLGWAYPSILACYAAQNISMSGNLRPTLYVALIGDKASGKSTTARRAMQSFAYKEPDAIVKDVPGSDRGLATVFGVKKPKKGEEVIPVLKTRLLYQDEMRHMLGKIDIRGSGLVHALNQLFYEDETGVGTRDGLSKLYVRLSILGCLKAADSEEFAKIFGAETNSGLYDRFIFGIAPKSWQFDDEWKPDPEARFPIVTEIPSLCFKMKNEWINAVEGEQKVNRGRLGELALRVALISANANRETEVSEACMQSGLEFATWQEAVRDGYKAGVAESQSAMVTESIINTLEKFTGQWVRWRDLCRKKNWYRKHGEFLVRAKKSLVEQGVLLEQSMKNDQGALRKTGLVMYRASDE